MTSSMDDDDLKSLIHYYFREKLYHSMQVTAIEGLKRFPTDLSFSLYNGFALVLERRIQEGMREFDRCQQDSDLILASLIGLAFAHRKYTTIDKEALTQIDARIREERKKISENSLYYAGLMYLYTNKLQRARECIERVLRSNSKNVGALVLKGWIELAAGKDSKFKDSSQYFDAALEISKRNVDAIFGKARYREMENDFEAAINDLNTLIVRFPAFNPPLIEKMKNQLYLLYWDQAVETANRILAGDPQSLEAMKMNILSYICKEANYQQAASDLRKLFSEMESAEPKNSELFFENGKLFSRVCGRNFEVLAETFRFVEKSAQLDPSQIDFMTELGYQALLQGKYKEATRFYRNASKMDESSISALVGLTRCQLAEGGNLDQARQQIEFLREIQGSNLSPELLFMSAQILVGEPDKAIGYLNEAIESHLRSVRTMSFGTKYLSNLDPDFLLQIVKLLLSYSPNNASSATQIPQPLKQCLTVLELITKSCPGLLNASYLLAKVQFQSGDAKSAMKTLENIIDSVDSTYADAHLLMAQIQLQLGNLDRAAQSLELGLSFNFQVRDRAMYHLILAPVQKKRNQIKECIASLLTAKTLSSKRPDELSLSDRATMLIELADAYRISGQIDEALKTVHQASYEFQGTSEEGRVTTSSADLALVQGDTRMALELLNSISQDSPYFHESRNKIADIYLNNLKDQQAFVKTIRELVAKAPGPQSSIILGDAYMKIQEPDRAIEAYEQALKRNPRDTELAQKIGRALIKTHQYSKAVNYYKEAVKGDETGDLKLDLAELFMKLSQYEKAEKTLASEMENRPDPSDIISLSARTKVLLLLAKIREKSGNLQLAQSTLREAKDNQWRVLKRQPDSSENVLLTANICCSLAEIATQLRDNEAAIDYYKEALNHIPGDPEILIALSRLYMQSNDLDSCAVSCSAILKTDPNNESAIVMLADLAFRKVDFQAASSHFQQLLERRPDYWTALARLVEVSRRTGNLEAASPFLERAEGFSSRSANSPGLAYCRGLYDWYNGDHNSALQFFNQSRRDPEWGQQAIHNMIEICLDSDNTDLNEEEDLYGNRLTAIRTGERLLKELQPRPGEETLNHRLLGDFLLLGTRQKMNVERALHDLASLASQENFRDNVGIALGLAQGYLILKQTPRARNQLKRIAKNTWSFEDAEYLERCWVLLADIYVQNSKYEMAQELLKRVLQHNQACTKAYELSGVIAEKDQKYLSASHFFERAWRFSGRSNTNLGHRLAYTFMKAKRYADAIDTCQQVLKLQPDFPRIRKEILEKSRNNLRT